jgi:hypothetical protein
MQLHKNLIYVRNQDGAKNINSLWLLKNFLDTDLKCKPGKHGISTLYHEISSLIMNIPLHTCHLHLGSLLHALVRILGEPP